MRIRKSYFLLGVFAILYRLGLLIFQRSIGMEWDFHIDATYYVEKARLLNSLGLGVFVADGGYENVLYVLIAYLIYELFVGVFEYQNILIFFNIFISGLSVYYLCRIFDFNKSVRYPIPAIFFAVSPYLAHLSVHPLKDTLCLFLSILIIFGLLNNKLLLIIFSSVLLVSARFYLGIIFVFGVVFWLFFLKFNTEVFKYVVMKYIVIFFIILLMGGTLSERIEVEFEGRDFYSNGFALVPENMYLRFLFGGFFNFLIPFPFFPSGISEVGYFLHWIIFTSIIIFVVFNRRCRGGDMSQMLVAKRSSYNLIITSLFLFAFVVTTTPGAGPLVRYRLAIELLILIAFYFKIYGFFGLKGRLK